MTPSNKNIFQDKITDDTIITGGHFMLIGANLPCLNTGTIQSFEDAVSTYKSGVENGVRIGFGILINDMGAVCDSKKKTCSLNNNLQKAFFSLPNEYLQILNKYEINKNDIRIYWEKNLRNQGKKELHKKISKNEPYLEFMEGAYWFINPADGRKITLSRPNSNDKYGIAACPLIMASLAHQMQKDGFNSSLNFYYIDLDNEENIPNYFAIEKGRIVAETFYENLNIMNVYLLKDRTVTSFDLGKI